MSKCLIVADLHLHDYSNRNPEPLYRLNQTDKVAENIILVGKKEGVDKIIFAGDVVEKFLVPPYIQGKVKEFLDNIMGEFQSGFCIFGNHDVEYRSARTDGLVNSFLSLILPQNLLYVNKKQFTIENTSLAFNDYETEFDLSWINGQVDFLITHATISYGDDDSYISQVLDESKFKCAICGDIHKAAQKGKYVSIGNGQRCKMGDDPKATGIVLDFTTKEYYWVDLNPNDNLMKFEYTDQKEKEGWDKDAGTWFVYNPTITMVSNGSKQTQLQNWKNIDTLIDSNIKECGLEDIHSEVLAKNPDLESKEVDFDFQLTWAHVKNFRSIDECTLYFNEGDRIYIKGDNGSGKSSLLSAIQYALVENPHYKDLIQFGSNECLVEVEFFYQGIKYKIQRGSKQYGLWINDQKQGFHGKKEFEDRCHQLFPFIDYMDAYIFNDGHSRFIGDITPERKSEIISKFFRLDRIDVYSDTASKLLDSCVSESKGWIAEVNQLESHIGYLQTKIDALTLPDLTATKLLEERERGIKLQKAAKEYNEYQIGVSQVTGQIHSSQYIINDYTERTKGFRSTETIDSEIGQLRNEISQIDLKLRELSRVESEGKRLCDSYRSLGETKYCPTCKRKLDSPEHLEEHKSRLEKEIGEEVQKQKQLLQDLQDLGLPDKNQASLYVSSRNQKISELMSEKQNQDWVLNNLESEKLKLQRLQVQLQSYGEAPAKVELPDDFMQKMSQIDAALNVWSTYNTYLSEKNKSQARIEECRVELERINKKIDKLKLYITATGPTGNIYKQIMERFAVEFSDNKVAYAAVSTVGRGVRKDHLNLDSSFIINENNKIRYVNASAGQRTVLDLDFLSKIAGRLGLLILDEFLAHLDGNNLSTALGLIKGMNIGTTLLCSHAPDLDPGFYNRIINLQLNKEGTTTITI